MRGGKRTALAEAALLAEAADSYWGMGYGCNNDCKTWPVADEAGIKDETRSGVIYVSRPFREKRSRDPVDSRFSITVTTPYGLVTAYEGKEPDKSQSVIPVLAIVPKEISDLAVEKKLGPIEAERPLTVGQMEFLIGKDMGPDKMYHMNPSTTVGAYLAKEAKKLELTRRTMVVPEEIARIVQGHGFPYEETDSWWRSYTQSLRYALKRGLEYEMDLGQYLDKAKEAGITTVNDVAWEKGKWGLLRKTAKTQDFMLANSYFKQLINVNDKFAKKD